MQSLLEKFDLFIFDWDGTLSTSTFLVRLSNLVRRRYKPWYIKEHMDEYRKMAMSSESVKTEETKHKFYDDMYEMYSVFVKPRLREGVIPLLETFEGSRKKTGIFTDSKQYRISKEMKFFGVQKYFDLVISSETIHAYKPNPTGLEIMIKKLHAKKSRSIYIGDMATDAITAKLAGISSCGVAGGVDSYARLKEGEPDYLFDSIEDFAKALK
jgi:pyrophosphatase PpaX